MGAKVIATLVWVAVFFGVEYALRDVTWAQYAAVIILCGGYGLILNKISKSQAGNR